MKVRLLSQLAAAWQQPPRRQLGQVEELSFTTPLAVGTWQAGNRLLYDYSPERDEALLAAWRLARERGVAYFDTGDSYGTGEFEGNAEALLGQFARGDEIIHTKLATYPWRLTPDQFVGAARASLLRLRASKVALVGQHWSAATYGLGAVQDGAVYAGLAKCCTEGLAAGVGLSNLGPIGLRDGVTRVNDAGAPVATHQTQFSLLCRAPLEDGSFDVADELGVTSVGYSPLALGLLSGRYTSAQASALGTRSGSDDIELPRGVRGALFRFTLPKLAPLLAALEDLADANQASVSQTALAWTLAAARPSILPLVGARSPEYVEDALGAVALARRLSPSDVQALAAVAATVPQAQTNAFQTA